MGLKEDIELGLSIHQIGDSQGPVFPKHWRERLNVEKGDQVDATADFDEGTVTYHF
jgi:antitoxin component of MazEF toxin-antitoxin module